MTEPQPSVRRLPRSWPGRLVIYVPFAALVLWVAVALLNGFLADLYGDPPAPQDRAGLERWCVRRLGALRGELETRVASDISVEIGAGPREHPPGDGPLQRWQSWNREFRARLETATGHCRHAEAPPEMVEAYGQLDRLHDQYRAHTEAILLTRTTVGDDLEQSVRLLVTDD